MVKHFSYHIKTLLKKQTNKTIDTKTTFVVVSLVMMGIILVLMEHVMVPVGLIGHILLVACLND